MQAQKGAGLYPPLWSQWWVPAWVWWLRAKQTLLVRSHLRAPNKIVLWVECVSSGKKRSWNRLRCFQNTCKCLKWGFLPLCPLPPVHSKWSADKRCSLCRSNFTLCLSPAVLVMRRRSWRGDSGQARRKDDPGLATHPWTGSGGGRMLYAALAPFMGYTAREVVQLHVFTSSAGWWFIRPKRAWQELSFDAWLSDKYSPLVAAELSFYDLCVPRAREKWLFLSSLGLPAALIILAITIASI